LEFYFLGVWDGEWKNWRLGKEKADGVSVDTTLIWLIDWM
jgi:hypothetical protein